MRGLIGGVVLLGCLCSCGAAPPVVAQTAPVMTRAEAQQLMETADMVRSEAFATPNRAVLRQVFRDPALKELLSHVDAMAMRGLRLEEKSAVRSLVSFDPGRSEGVLQVTASDRLITQDQADPGWSSTARQVWSRFEYWRGSWWVADEKDLSPDLWQPAA